MSKRAGLRLTIEQVRAHQEKNFGNKWPELSEAHIDEVLEHHGFKPKRAAKLPNATEREYGLILEARKRKGELVDYFYEGITLKWGDGMRYTPDYVVYYTPGILPPLLIEVKGGHIWDRDLVRFKGCKAEWKEHYDFQMHQKKQGTWSRIL